MERVLHQAGAGAGAGGVKTAITIKEHDRAMKDATIRLIFRWIHIVCSIPIIGYIYSPFAELPNYAPPTRFVFLPIMLLSGLWMWKGHVLRRLVSQRSVRP